jgi:hypothetical protein
MTCLKKTLPALAVLAALAGAAPAIAGDDSDLRDQALAQIDEAGSSAGLARACGVDPTPITAAVKQLLKRVPLDSPSETNALARYRANEAHMTRDALAASGAPPCGDLRSVVRDAVRDLNVIAAPEMTARSETPAAPAGK